MNPQDNTLLDRWQSQADADAFRELVHRYANLVYATAVRTLGDRAAAEDIAQDTFLKLAQVRRVDRSLGAWLHRVATNQSRDRIKTDARRRTREHAWSQTRPTTTDSTWDDIREHLDAAIDELPESLRAVVIGHYLENRSHDELARTLGLTRSAVSKRSARGIAQLRDALRKRGVAIAAPALAALMTEHATAHTAPASLMTALNEIGLVGRLALAKTTGGGLFSMQSILGISAIAAIAGGTFWYAFSAYENISSQPQASAAERTGSARREPDEVPELAQSPDPTPSAAAQLDYPTLRVAQATPDGEPTPSRVYDADSMNPLSGVPVHIAKIPQGVPFFTAPPGELAGFDMNVRIPQAGVNILAVDSSPIGLMRAVMFEATGTTPNGRRAQIIPVELDFAPFDATDTNGEFVLDEIEPGEYVLIAYASRYYTHSITTFSAVEGAPLPWFDIPLEPCGVIEGRAFLNREPFAKATITIQGNPGQIEWIAQTDANGNYCVGGIVMPEGQTAIEGAFRGRTVTEGYGSRYSLMLDARVEPGKTTTLDLDWIVGTSTVEGHVYRVSDGVGLRANGNLIWQYANGDNTNRDRIRFASDDDGYFTVENVIAGPVIVEVFSHGFEGTLKHRQLVDVPEDERVTVDFAYHPTYITVEVSNPPDGESRALIAIPGEYHVPEPVTSWEQVMQFQDAMVAAAYLRDNNQGVLNGLAPGRYTIVASILPTAAEFADFVAAGDDFLANIRRAYTFIDLTEGEPTRTVHLDFNQ